MKVLLINPNSSLINKSWAYKKFFTPIAPLGLAYIAAFLEKNGIEADILDHFANRISDRELTDLIKRKGYNLVGFSALTPVMPDVIRLSQTVRSSFKDVKIILGNIHGTCFPEEVLENGIADIVVRGEGEITMLELCRNLDKNKSLQDIKGISFKDGGKIFHNPEREIIEDLDSLPFPAWHLLELNNYREVPLAGIYKSLAMPIMASRGCPYRCYYCSQDKIYKKVRYRKLSKVVDEMEYFCDNFGVRHFGFTDAYFPFDEESGLEFCSLLKERKFHRKIKWCTETRVDKVSLRLLKSMKEVGAHLIMYGIEVGSQKVLSSLNKDIDLEHARVALKETRKAGIFSQGLFILGLPGETKDTCIETINFAKKLDCDFVKFNIAVPYPGSRFFEDFKQLKKEVDLEKFTSWFDWADQSKELIYAPEGMDSPTLRGLQRKAMLDFYMRPKVIIRHILNGTISHRNLFFGGIWLLTLFYQDIIKRLGLSRAVKSS